MLNSCLRSLRLVGLGKGTKNIGVSKLFASLAPNRYLSCGTPFLTNKDFKNPFNFDTTSRHTEDKADSSNSSDEPGLKNGKLIDQADITALPSEKANFAEGSSSSGASSRPYKKKSRVTPSASEQSARSTFRTGSLFLLGLTGFGLYSFLSDYSQEELVDNAEYSQEDPMSVRAQKRLSAFKNYFFKPKYTALLPPQQEAPGQQTLTLVINLDETLIKVIWDREHGYRVAKRPGLERFLGILFQLCEVVIFTSQQEFNARPLIEKLDQYHMYHHYLLTRDSTTRVDGKIVKDLSLLNRDLSQVIMMDNNPDHFSLQPDNAILVPAWDGSPDDRYLLDILPFLETLALTNPKDVRVILKKYYGKDIPKALRELELEKQRELAQKKNSGLRRLLGWGPSDSEGSLPLIPIMTLRRTMEQSYDQQKDGILRHHKEHYDKMMEEEKRLLSETKMTGWNVILRNFVPPPDSPEASKPKTQ